MPPYPTVTLKNGSQGQQVATLQALLNLDYPAYSHLDVDGEFGAQRSYFPDYDGLGPKPTVVQVLPQRG